MPRLRSARVLFHLPTAATFWGLGGPAELEQGSAGQAVQALQPELAGWADALTGEACLELDLSVLGKAAERCRADVIALSVAQRGGVAWLERVASHCGVPAMWVGGKRQAAREGGRHVLVPFETELRSLAPAAVFLRDRLDSSDQVTLLALAEPPPTHAAQLTGIQAKIRLERFEAGLSDFAERLVALVAQREVDAIVLPRAALGALTQLLLRVLGNDVLQILGVPVIVLPGTTASPVDRLWQGRLDAPDVLSPRGRRLRLLIERLDVLGRPEPLEHDELVVVAEGKLLARCPVRAGLAEVGLPETPLPKALGLGLDVQATPRQDPLLDVELGIRLVDPQQRRVVLLDPDLRPSQLRRCAEVFGARSLLVAVRLKPEQSCAELRARLAAAGLNELPLLAAGLLLDDGRPDDQPGGFEPVRLLRVAARLRAQGIQVEALVSSGTGLLHHRGCTFWTAAQLAELADAQLRERVEADFRPAPQTATDDLDETLLELTGAQSQTGNSVEILIDNARARRKLFALIDAATRRIHVQVYIVRDDPFTRRLLQKLQAAAQRGVRLRILVDSLYSLHGSFGQENAVLVELARCQSAEVLSIRPVAHLPDLDDLKRRDHRKLWTFDGQQAIVTGRNLAQEYYTGFDEVTLGPDTPALQIPWLDAGAAVAGPLVVQVEAAFMRTWLQAGGGPFALRNPADAGAVKVRLVLHEGGRDAHTLDAYLAIIRATHSQLLIANTFPFQKELLHALLHALHRGVRLRLLIGHVRPVFGAQRTPFPGGALRELATQVVLGRVDQLVAAGAEAYELAFSGLPGWDPTLGTVRPHLHAKLVCADGQVCTVGSANLDIASGYWESESLLVIDDAPLARQLEGQLETLLRGAVRIDPQDPTWQTNASWRAALTALWPSVIA